MDLLRLASKPVHRRLGIERVDAPQVERDGASAGESLSLGITVIFGVQIDQVPSRPRIRADHLIFRHFAVSHEASLADRTIDNTIARQSSRVILQTARSCFHDVFGKHQIDSAIPRLLLIGVVVFVRLPSVAVVGAVDVLVPTLAPSLVAPHVRLIVEMTVSAGAPFGHILGECRTIVLGQRAFATRLQPLLQRDRHHLIDSLLLRRVTMNHDQLPAFILFHRRPPGTIRLLIANEIRHQSVTGYAAAGSSGST